MREPANAKHYKVASKTEGDPHIRSTVVRWFEVLSEISSWSGRINMEIHTPDLWTTFGRDIYVSPAAGEGNTPFTRVEQQQIAQSLHRLRKDVRRSDLSEEQADEVEEKLDYLIAASRRVGRLDWRNLVAGTILTMIADATLPPETTRHIIRMILLYVGHRLWGVVPELPP